MNDEEKRLVDKFNTASRKISQQLNSPKGGSQAESEYRDAYQKLVQAGLAQQIKKKYR